jgi:uncharacterized protein (TIGR00297 family)
MTREAAVPSRSGPAALRWQSQAVLLATVPFIGSWVTLVAGMGWPARDPVPAQAALISLGFAALVYAMRAATPGAALTGGLFTAALYLRTPGWHTALWPLLALFLLTHAATRFGRHRKETLGIAEAKQGRRASQVAANLGVAVLASIPFSATQIFSLLFHAEHFALIPMVAALAEATADTVSSELGQVLGGEPRLLTTLQRVPAGTDGAISVAGTLTGCLAAAIVTGVAALVLPLRGADALVAFGSAVFGLFFDSLLGAVAERRGWVNNDAVNFLSTLAAAAVAAWAAGFR